MDPIVKWIRKLNKINENMQRTMSSTHPAVWEAQTRQDAEKWKSLALRGPGR